MINVLDLIDHFDDQQQSNDQRNQSTQNALQRGSRCTSRHGQNCNDQVQNGHLVNAQVKGKDEYQFGSMHFDHNPKNFKHPFRVVVLVAEEVTNLEIHFF